MRTPIITVYPEDFDRIISGHCNEVKFATFEKIEPGTTIKIQQAKEEGRKFTQVYVEKVCRSVVISQGNRSMIPLVYVSW